MGRPGEKRRLHRTAPRLTLTSNLQLPFESQLQQLASLHQHQHHPSFPSTPHSRSPSSLISSTLCVTRAAVAVATASHPHRIVQYSTVQYLRVRHPPPPSSKSHPIPFGSSSSSWLAASLCSSLFCTYLRLFQLSASALPGRTAVSCIEAWKLFAPSLLSARGGCLPAIPSLPVLRLLKPNQC